MIWWIVGAVVVVGIGITILDWTLCKISAEADEMTERIRAHEREGM